MLVIKKESQRQAGCLQVAKALGQMRRSKAIHAFRLDNKNVLNYEVRLELADGLTLVGNGIGNLGDCCDPAKG